MIRSHTKNTATTFVQVAHNITGKFIRNSYFHRYNWL